MISTMLLNLVIIVVFFALGYFSGDILGIAGEIIIWPFRKLVYFIQKRVE